MRGVDLPVFIVAVDSGFWPERRLQTTDAWTAAVTALAVCGAQVSPVAVHVRLRDRYMEIKVGRPNLRPMVLERLLIDLRQTLVDNVRRLEAAEARR